MADQGPGLAAAYKNLASALRVVESGDRETPAQAIAVYEQSSRNIQQYLREWNDFQSKQLPELNQRLHGASQAVTP
jgi:hypothetical protein